MINKSKIQEVFEALDKKLNEKLRLKAAQALQNIMRDLHDLEYIDARVNLNILVESVEHNTKVKYLVRNFSIEVNKLIKTKNKKLLRKVEQFATKIQKIIDPENY